MVKNYRFMLKIKKTIGRILFDVVETQMGTLLRHYLVILSICGCMCMCVSKVNSGSTRTLSARCLYLLLLSYTLAQGFNFSAYFSYSCYSVHLFLERFAFLAISSIGFHGGLQLQSSFFRVEIVHFYGALNILCVRNFWHWISDLGYLL